MSTDYYMADQYKIAEALADLPDRLVSVIRYCLMQERDLLDLSTEVPPGIVSTEEIAAWIKDVNLLCEAVALIEAL